MVLVFVIEHDLMDLHDRRDTPWRVPTSLQISIASSAQYALAKTTFRAAGFPE